MRAARLAAKTAEQVFGQFGNVFDPIAQRRQEDFERVDAVHQVFAEVAGRDHFRQVAMRGAHDAHIHNGRPVFAHAANLAAFQHAQQLGLHRLRQLADFVEKDRAAVGNFKQADAVLIGAGERTLAVAEQLAFDERFRQRAAIDRDKRLAGARALVVNGAGDQFLAGAGLAQDEHGRLRGRNFGDQRANAIHAGRSADQPRRAFDALQPALERAVLLRELALILHAAHQRLDLDELARLREIIERAVSQRGDGRLERRLAGQHDGFGIGAQLLRPGDHIDAVEARHIEIDEQTIERVLLQRRGGGEAVRANRDAMAHPRNLELHQLLQRSLVVGKEDGQALGVVRAVRVIR